LLVERPTESAQWAALRRELGLGLPELARLKTLLPGNIFTGTFAEASRLRLSLAEIIATDLQQASVK
jgi:hypothetical protein